MPLSENTQNAIKELFKDISSPVEMTVFGQKGDQIFEVEKELLGDLSGLSILQFKALDIDSEQAKKHGIEKSPTIILKKYPGVRFVGLPSGHEFRTFLEAMVMAGKGRTKLCPESVAEIKKVNAPLDIKVFVTPTCPYCPPAVITALQMAMENEKITASMVEASEFPDLSEAYQIRGVPRTVVNDADGFEGSAPEHVFVKKVLSLMDKP
jgi:glutaredoxin-like protein